mgnify:CR=1
THTAVRKHFKRNFLQYVRSKTVGDHIGSNENFKNSKILSHSLKTTFIQSSITHTAVRKHFKRNFLQYVR